MSFGGLLESYKKEERRDLKRPRDEETEERIPEWAQRSSDLGPNEKSFRRALLEGAKTASEKIMLLKEKTKKDLKKSRELTVCILCVDGVPHEKIWRHWADRCEAEEKIKVMFYIHAHKREKACASSEWVKEHLIDKHFLTPWGSIQLCQAASALLGYALKDPDNDLEFAALASDSCLPIASPKEVGNALFKDDELSMSWIPAFDKPDNGYAVDKQWKAVSNVLPLESIWKAPQWLLFNRDHARLISLGLPAEVRIFDFHKRDRHDTFRLFEKATAADELYFPSLLAVAGEIKRQPNTQKSTNPKATGIIAPRIQKRALTYCDWSNGGRSPATLPELTPELVHIARKEGCLFARKFPPSSSPSPEQWDNAIRLASLPPPSTQEDQNMLPPRAHQVENSPPSSALLPADNAQPADQDTDDVLMTHVVDSSMNNEEEEK